MTRLCSPWDYSQRDEYPADGFAQFLHPSVAIDSKEMDDMLVQCNKNSVYVLNSSYRYRDFDMIELFGSPAGRALTVNNRTAAEMHSCSKSNSSSNIASISSNSASTTQNHSALCQQPLYHPLQNCGFSGTCSTISAAAANHSSHHSTASSTANCNKFVDANDLIRYRASHPHPHTTHLPTATPTTNHGGSSSSRTNSKMAKIWKLFDEDRIQNKGSTTNATTTSSNGGSEFFSRCQRRKSNPSEEKSTKDLYNEAAQLLGIRCTLSDSCRCIDCQSQYFDCDDFDSYSEYSDRSYDPEDNFVVNQSYFTSNDTSRHPDLSEVVCQQHQLHHHHQINPSEITAINGQKDDFDGAENEDDNGNNKDDQYSRHGGISGQVHETETDGGRMRRRKCNETEIGPEQQNDSASISTGRDYAVANGINELEVNSNLEA
ncbi:uncharacterized protein LOC6043806 isoform X2 [Culex quinquefasciatus]|uniref:uncharacterized protein LOC6043806 isoform X2 n=1 Tax=Culex quinquefasciatus TaxID=7176 RepID=UPI0018E36537|nr:uncharacterized protein LOC6043806 isoform X2 [Culex quinquefasciatus]